MNLDKSSSLAEEVGKFLALDGIDLAQSAVLLKKLADLDKKQAGEH